MALQRLHFSEDDPENRNNKQFTGNLTYFVNTASSGRHELKAGYDGSGTSTEATRSRRLAWCSAPITSPTDGAPVFGSDGRMIPIFEPGVSRLEVDPRNPVQS